MPASVKERPLLEKQRAVLLDRLSVKVQSQEAGRKDRAVPVETPVLPPLRAVAAESKPSKYGVGLSDDVHLRELEKIKSVVKEQQVRKSKPDKFKGEEMEILDKIDKLIQSAQPIHNVSLFDKITGLLGKAESDLASGDCLRAEVTYDSIKPLYSGLSESEKEIVYPRLFDFFRRLKVALDAYSAVKPVKVRQDAALLKEEEELLGKLEALKGAIS